MCRTICDAGEDKGEQQQLPRALFRIFFMIYGVPRREATAQDATLPAQIMLAEWLCTQALAGDLEDRAGQRRPDGTDRWFADLVVAFVVGERFEMDVDFRGVAHANHRILVVIAFDDPPMLDVELLVQREIEAEDRAALPAAPARHPCSSPGRCRRRHRCDAP